MVTHTESALLSGSTGHPKLFVLTARVSWAQVASADPATAQQALQKSVTGNNFAGGLRQLGWTLVPDSPRFGVCPPYN